MTSRQERGVVGLIAALVAGAQILGFHALRHDDAFISFRYGQNLSRGRGLVFNPGVRVMGSTSPADVLASGAVHAAVGDAWLPSVMSALGCVAWTAAAVALYLLLRRSLDASTRIGPGGARAVAASAALGLALGATGAESWVALETNWASAAVLGALAAAAARRHTLATVLAALAAWIRPDAVLVVIPVAVVVARATGWRVLRWAALYVALVAPWYVFAWAYYGDPLPQSLRAKTATSDALAYARHLFEFAAWTLAPQLPAWLGWALGLGGWAALLRRAPGTWTLAVYGALQTAAYLVLRPGVAYTWHLQPVVLFLLVGVVAGGGAAIAGAPRAVRLPGALAVVAFLGAAGVRTWRHASTYRDEVWIGQRDAVYTEAAAYLAERSAPDDLVSTEEPGTIAYWSDLPMNDRAGIVTRHPFESLRRFQAGQPTKLRWLVLRKPELEPARSIYGRREPRVFRRGDYRIFVYDLRAPEAPAALE